MCKKIFKALIDNREKEIKRRELYVVVEKKEPPPKAGIAVGEEKKIFENNESPVTDKPGRRESGETIGWSKNTLHDVAEGHQIDNVCLE